MMETHEHEQIVYCCDKTSGLKAIIAIHNTTLGPGLGGLRMWPYAKEEEALFDVLRLSKGMTYKNAAAGLNLGGGKAVIIADPKQKSEALYRAFGRFVQSLGGRYITAEDVNTTSQDILLIQEETSFVTGAPEWAGGGGDPGPHTALGVFEGIKASVQKRLNKASLDGIHVAVQGVGSVGTYLCEHLNAAGAQLTISDIREKEAQSLAERLGASVVKPDEVYGVEADVFSPCALGAVVNDQTLPQFKCSVIAGAANNQLLEEDNHGNALKDKGILYAPDYIINAGGVINCYYDYIGQHNTEIVESKVKGIAQTLSNIYEISEEENVSTHLAAAHFAEQRIQTIAKVRSNYLGT